MNNKTMYIVLGCNGSGKTTIFNSLLKNEFTDIPYINTDEISKNLQENGMNKASANSKSSFLSLSKINEHRKKEESFIIESLIASDSSTGIIQIINEMKNDGYKIKAYFIHTQDVNININNVYKRFSKGLGHDVPVEVIIDRFKKTEQNIQNHFKLFDKLNFIDNSNYDFKEVGEYENGSFKNLGTTQPSWLKEILKNDDSYLNKIIENCESFTLQTNNKEENNSLDDSNNSEQSRAVRKQR